MSIPGLGQIPTQTSASSVRTITLQPFWEWRFSVPHRSTGITVRLVNGTAERDGTELAPNQPYSLSGTRSSLLTWHGCILQVNGQCEDYVAECPGPEYTPAVSYLNLHSALQMQRNAASRSAAASQPQQQPLLGPRVLICGPPSSGKTTLAKTLVALATKMSSQPLLVSVDPREGMMSLPGTVSAAVFSSIMDVESREGGIGVGGTPSSGPSAIPVKLPLVYYFGKEKAEDDISLWYELVGSLANATSSRLAQDSAVRSAGVIIDVPAVDPGARGMEMLTHVAREFAVNVVVVLGSAQMTTDLEGYFSQQTTKYGEAVTVVMLDKSTGVVEKDKDRDFMQLNREAAIKEYFFGDSRRTLSPSTQFVGFDELSIFTAPDHSEQPDAKQTLIPVEASPDMSYSTLAVMNASVSDAPGDIRRSPVMGFVYIADVDNERRRLKVLAPVSGRLGDRPMILGQWPEACMDLIG